MCKRKINESASKGTFIRRSALGALSVAFALYLGTTGFSDQVSKGYPAIPTANLEVEGRVPMSMLIRIADHHARCVWGDDIAQGRPLPVVDADGNVSAYIFPYVRNSHDFPGYEAVFDAVRNARQLHDEAEEEGGCVPESFQACLTRTAGEFGSVYVSATRRNLPILRVDHFLHPYFVVGEMAQEQARYCLDCRDVRLERLYSVNPCEEYFEFIGEGRRVLLDVHTLNAKEPGDVPESKTVASTGEELDKLIKDSWDVLVNVAAGHSNDEAQPFAQTIKHLPSLELVPPILWTLNCATTSKAMVLGYWDHYVPQAGTILGFGRLVDYWYEHPSNGNNVPNLLEEVHAANTMDVWQINNYNYEWTEIPANAGNDWAWQEYTSEIDSDRPTCWSYTGHTMAGVGYHIETWGKWAIVYNTWDTNLSEFPYTLCIAVARIIPKGGSNGDHQVILAPYGAESYAASTPAEINWYDWGQKIDTTHLFYSGDGGQNWTPLASDIPTQEGGNSYRWLPGPQTLKGRVRLEGYGGNEYIAGDGSYQNFSIQPQGVDGGWIKIFGPVGMVVAGYDESNGTSLIYATDLTTGDIHQFMGKPGVYWNWFKVGGPGKMFVLDGQGKLYGLSTDGSGVYQYTGTPMQWTQIGGAAAEIYGDVDGVCATNPDTGDIYRYLGSPFSWLKVGGPGKAFACDAEGRLYGISPDGSGVYRYDGLFGPPIPWIQVGGPAANLYARGLGVYATNPDTGDIYFFHGKPFRWTRVGGPGKTFSVDVNGRLYGLSPDESGVYRYDGSFSTPAQWTQIGGAAADIYAGWGEILAKNPQTNELYILTTP
jgi:hypothetical protein